MPSLSRLLFISGKSKQKKANPGARFFRFPPLLRLPPDKVPLVLSFQGENRKRERLFRFPLPRLFRFFFPAENAGQKKANPGARFFRFPSLLRLPPDKVPLVLSFQGKNRKRERRFGFLCPACPGFSLSAGRASKRKPIRERGFSVFPLCSACRQIKFLWFFPFKERTEKRREKAPYSAARCHVSHTQATQHCAHFGFLASQTCLPW